MEPAKKLYPTATTDLLDSAVTAYLSGEGSIRQVASRYGVHKTSLHRKISEYSEDHLVEEIVKIAKKAGENDAVFRVLRKAMNHVLFD